MRKSTGVMAFDAKVLAHNLPVYQRIPFFRSRFRIFLFALVSHTCNIVEVLTDKSVSLTLGKSANSILGAPLFDTGSGSVTD
jgi:hypothetical protein